MIKDQRYSRQSVLAEVGPAGQERLSRARVLVVGAGGLGCPALQYLAGSGVGVIGIVDPDTVDVSNLHRQTLYATQDQGKPKVDVAKERLLQLNPDIAVRSYHELLTDKNALALMSGYDVVLDGTDNFAARFLINDAAVKAGLPVVYGAIQGFDGQVSVFDASHGPCYRCLYSRPPESAVMNCAEAGVIGALAGIIGTVQAMEAIKLIVGDASFSPLVGRLWMVDTRTMETRIIKVPKKKDCTVCSRPAADIVLPAYSPACRPDEPKEVTCDEIDDFDDVLMVDVRELHEWDAGHIEGAQHLPLSALSRDISTFSSVRKGPCILYCQRGQRSLKAAEILREAGYRDIFSLKGGYTAWCARQHRS